MTNMVMRARLLIIEDHPAVARSLDLLLTQTGYRCVIATTAEQALALDHQLFDAALIDLELPGIGGVELADRIRSKRPGIKIIFMTGSLTQADRIAEKRHEVLLKPFRPNQLRDALARLSARRSRFTTTLPVQISPPRIAMTTA